MSSNGKVNGGRSGLPSNTHYTPTEVAILSILLDGWPHKWSELVQCLPDELSGKTSLQVHISNVRKKLRRKGQDILIAGGKPTKYQLVRLTGSAVNGYR